jgi:hypothetical protein
MAIVASCIAQAGIYLVLAIGDIGDGCYELQVTVKSASATPITKVGCFASFTDEAPKKVVESLPPPDKIAPWEARPFDGQSLSIDVWHSTHTYCFGLLRFDYQERHLAIVVEYLDGKRAGKVVEIPHRSVSRLVEVEVP